MVKNVPMLIIVLFAAVTCILGGATNICFPVFATKLSRKVNELVGVDSPEFMYSKWWCRGIGFLGVLFGIGLIALVFREAKR
jgi:hypothetical protein